ISLSFGVHSIFKYDVHGLFTTPFLSLNYTIRIFPWLAFLSEVDVTSLIKQKQSSTFEGTPSKINDENISILSKRYSLGILLQLTNRIAIQYKHDFEYSYKYDLFIAPLSYRNAESDGKFFNRERLSFIINFNKRWRLQYEWIKNEASIANFESYFWISLYW
ncbi:hypothetical protein JXR93_00135, partial [bacterium]|nr:hypothetical protein [bacterium]